MSGDSGDFEEPVVRQNQWVERHGGQVTKRKDQPTGYGYESGGKSKGEMKADAAAEEIRMYEGMRPGEVIKDAKQVVEVVTPVRMGIGKHREEVEAHQQLGVSESGAGIVQPESVVSDPWDGLGSPNRPVPEVGGQAIRRGTQRAKHFR